jgi:chromate transporter
MNVFLLYLVLLKATVTSFSGLTSIPVVRADFVERHHLMTDHQLAAAIAAGRVGPGPAGLYIVSVGYTVAGIPGAIAGWLAMITPAFLVLPLLRFLGARADHPRLRGVIEGVTLAAAGLLVSITLTLARQSLSGALPMAVAAASALLLAFTRIDTLWVIAGAALAGFAGGLLS